MQKQDGQARALFVDGHLEPVRGYESRFWKHQLI